MKWTPEKIRDLPWKTKNQSQIARELGVSRQFVSELKERMRNPYLSKTERIDTSKIDWSKSDTVLGEELGLHRLTVAKLRREKRVSDVV